MGIIKINGKNNEIQVKQTNETNSAVTVEENQTKLLKKLSKKEKRSPVLSADDEKTTEYSKTYVLNNKTRKTIIHSSPVNYFDESEKEWKEIDNEFTKNSIGYQSKMGKYKLTLNCLDGSSDLMISGNGKKLSWKFLNATKKNINAVKVSKEGKLGKAIYENISSGIDLEYITQNNNLKENIIVNKKQDKYEYSFSIKTEALKLRLGEDQKSIELYDEITNNVEFIIPAPYMYDKNGAHSDDVNYEVTNTANGEYVFTVKASSEWINSNEVVLPVTIDPQILTARPEVMSFSYAQTNKASGYYNSYINNSLKVGIIGDVKYKAKITINKQKLALNTERIKRMRLYLTSTYQTHNTFIVNGDSENPYTQNSKVCSFDILDGFTSASDSYVFELTPSGNNYTEFYAVNGNRPYIEIEYVADDYIKHYKRSYDLVGGISGEFNVSTGEFNESFTSISSDNSVMGIPVTHHFKRSEQDFNVGDNFRLNLNETFEKNTNSQSEMTYIYTDERGNMHGFEKHYYYYVDGVKTYVNKENVTIESDGALKYNDYTVEVEHRSDTGLKAVTTFDGLKNIQFFEHRSDEQKQLEEQINSYKSTLKEFVVLNENGETVESFDNCLKGTLDYNNFISSYDNNSDYMLSVKGENETIKNLIRTKNKIFKHFPDTYILPEGIRAYEKSATICLQINTMNYHLIKICESNPTVTVEVPMACSTETKLIDSSEIKNYLLKGNVSGTLSYDILEQVPSSLYTKFFADELIFKEKLAENKVTPEIQDVETSYTGKQIQEMFRQYNLALHQYKEFLQEEEQLKETTETQLALYKDKSTDYYQTLTTYYKELVNCQAQLEKLKKEAPVNFITDGKIFKGYNENGRFVTLLDSSENYAVIEYEDYKINETQKGERISRMYDQNGNEVKFNYGKTSNLLTSIVGVNGKKVTFNYNYSSKDLTSVNWYGKNKVTFSYNDYGYIKSIIKDVTKVETTRANGKLCGLTWYNLLKSSPTKIDDLVIYYEQKANTNVPKVTFEHEKTKEVVTLDGYGYLSGIYVQDDGVYTKVEKHEYVPYRINNLVQSNPHYKVTTAPKKFLYTQELPQNESEWDVVTKFLNEFNKVTKQTTSEVDFITKNGVTYSKSEETVYVYDDEQNLTSKTLTENYRKSNTTAFTSRTTTTNYYYNTKNQLVKTETYIDGKQLTDGVQIEEKYYDGKGNVIKAVKYNSLDASSKLYTQTEYDESGKTIAEYDQTGENKTTLDYLGNAVANETLANGSKLGYGRDADDSVTSITQSTADGEENSTQKIYENDLVKKVISGNVEVEYNYTEKNKISSVKLNGVDNYIKYEYNDNITDEESGKTISTVKTTYNGSADYETVTDYLGNVIKTVYNGEVQTQNEYTPSGNLVSAVDNVVGKTETYTYDSFDRKTGYSAVKPSKNQTLLTEDYEYDEYGRLTKKREVCAFSNSYAYAYKDKFDAELTTIYTGALTIKPKKDALKRNTGKEIFLTYDGGNTSKIYEEQITYRKVGDHATNMPSTIRYGESKNGKYLVRDSIKYAYDVMGNISTVYQNGELFAKYTYDALNRLIREDNKKLGKTTLVTYDNVGNILNKREYNFTLKTATELEELLGETTEYYYDGEKLISYNGESFAYDVIGNPTTYRNKTLTWAKGRQLVNFDGVTFEYNGQGQRVKKNDVEYTYNSAGKLIYQTDGTNKLGYYYDEVGVCAIRYNSRTFGLRKNAQGDIIAIYNAFGEVLAKYTYDAWGNHTVTDVNGNDISSDATHIANLNPFRYRGYYFDVETGLYFLQTRYYDPEICRFITIDDISYLNPDVINGVNLYAYCGNNPIMNVDPSGCTQISLNTNSNDTFLQSIIAWIKKLSPIIDGISSMVSPIRTAIATLSHINLWEVMRLDGITELSGTLSKVMTSVGWGLSIIGGVVKGYEKYSSGSSVSSAIAGGVINAGINIGIMYASSAIATSLIGVLAASSAIPGGLLVVGGAALAIGIGIGLNYLISEVEICGDTIEGHINKFIDWLIWWD